MKYLALLSVFAFAQGRLFGEDQRICVKGKVECTSNPENQAKQIVKLWDNDRGPNPDDLMSEGITDEDGFFELCGTGSDAIGSIDPVFKLCGTGSDAIGNIDPVFKVGLGPNPDDLMSESITDEDGCFYGLEHRKPSIFFPLALSLVRLASPLTL